MLAARALVSLLALIVSAAAETTNSTAHDLSTCTDLVYPSNACCDGLVQTPMSCEDGDTCRDMLMFEKKLKASCEACGGDCKKPAAAVLPIAFSYACIVVLICMSGLFSGLTLGLMGLDKVGIEIVLGAGSMEDATDEQIYQAECAKKIKPIRENGNVLLCTLLLGNVAVNAMLSILMANLTSGMVGFLLSTVIITLFGEIAPQAVCARYALTIGARSVPLVQLIKFILYPLTYPISLALNCLLGEEIGSIHSTEELVNLLRIHVDHDAVDEEQGDIMIGAVTYKDKKIHEVMTPIDKVHMLSLDDKLNFQTVSVIFKRGFSRIPVYGRDRHDVKGMLFTKDLIFIDPEDETPVGQFVRIFGRPLFSTSPDQTLGQLLGHFKSGKGHMALVQERRKDAVHDVVRTTSFDEDQDQSKSRPQAPLERRLLIGVVTLEDIIEEILQDEIVDETDVYLEMEGVARVQRKERDFDYALLRLLDSSRQEKKLAAEEVKAVTRHLRQHHAETFAHELNGVTITESMVRNLIARSEVVVKDPLNADGSPNFIYSRGEVSTHCTIVLTGKLEIKAGCDGFRSFASAWAVIAPQSLTARNGAYKPDFSARVRDKLRCIMVSQAEFFGIVRERIFEDPGKILMRQGTEIQDMSNSPVHAPMHRNGDGSEDGGDSMIPLDLDDGYEEDDSDMRPRRRSSSEAVLSTLALQGTSPGGRMRPTLNDPNRSGSGGSSSSGSSSSGSSSGGGTWREYLSGVSGTGGGSSPRGSEERNGSRDRDRRHSSQRRSGRDTERKKSSGDTYGFAGDLARALTFSKR